MNHSLHELLEGHHNKMAYIDTPGDLDACFAACTEETEFFCKSFDLLSGTTTCSLSVENTLTVPITRHNGWSTGSRCLIEQAGTSY